MQTYKAVAKKKQPETLNTNMGTSCSFKNVKGQAVHSCSSGMRLLEGSGDEVNGLIMGIARVTIWVMGVINLLTKSP